MQVTNVTTIQSNRFDVTAYSIVTGVGMPLFTAKSEKARQESISPEFISLQKSPCGASVRYFFSVAVNDPECDPVGEASGKKGALAALIGVVMLLVSAVSFELWQYSPAVAFENGLLEMGQDFFLMIAVVTAFLRYRSVRFSESLDGYIFLGLSLFSLMFFLREVDIDQIGSSALWPIAEKTLRAIAAVLLLGFVFSVLRKSKLFLRNFASIIAAPVVMLTIVAGLLYFCSWPFDKRMFAIERGFSQMCEETIELNACLLFALAAFARGVGQDKKLL